MVVYCRNVSLEESLSGYGPSTRFVRVLAPLAERPDRRFREFDRLVILIRADDERLLVASQ